MKSQNIQIQIIDNDFLFQDDIDNVLDKKPSPIAVPGHGKETRLLLSTSAPAFKGDFLLRNVQSSKVYYPSSFDTFTTQSIKSVIPSDTQKSSHTLLPCQLHTTSSLSPARKRKGRRKSDLNLSDTKSRKFDLWSESFMKDFDSIVQQQINDLCKRLSDDSCLEIDTVQSIGSFNHENSPQVQCNAPLKSNRTIVRQFAELNPPKLNIKMGSNSSSFLSRKEEFRSNQLTYTIPISRRRASLGIHGSSYVDDMEHPDAPASSCTLVRIGPRLSRSLSLDEAFVPISQRIYFEPTPRTPAPTPMVKKNKVGIKARRVGICTSTPINVDDIELNINGDFVHGENYNLIKYYDNCDEMKRKYHLDVVDGSFRLMNGRKSEPTFPSLWPSLIDHDIQRRHTLPMKRSISPPVFDKYSWDALPPAEEIEVMEDKPIQLCIEGPKGKYDVEIDSSKLVNSGDFLSDCRELNSASFSNGIFDKSDNKIAEFIPTKVSDLISKHSDDANDDKHMTNSRKIETDSNTKTDTSKYKRKKRKIKIKRNSDTCLIKRPKESLRVQRRSTNLSFKSYKINYWSGSNSSLESNKESNAYLTYCLNNLKNRSHDSEELVKNKTSRRRVAKRHKSDLGRFDYAKNNLNDTKRFSWNEQTVPRNSTIYTSLSPHEIPSHIIFQVSQNKVFLYGGQAEGVGGSGLGKMSSGPQ